MGGDLRFQDGCAQQWTPEAQPSRLLCFQEDPPTQCSEALTLMAPLRRICCLLALLDPSTSRALMQVGTGARDAH